MKLQKYMHIILILLICMISISAVSAAEDTANDIISTDTNDNIILDETIEEDVSINDDNDDKATLKEGETSTEGYFIDLYNDINGNSNSEITLDCNYTYYNIAADKEFKDGIPINRDLTIDGQGHTINGSDQARIFNINSGTVTLKNIIFASGKSNEGSAIYGNCRIVNCTFIDNYASYYGGAVKGDCTIINSTFQNNFAAYCGGAIRGSCTINNSQFIENFAHEGGGAIHGDCIIDNSQFIENHAHSMSVDAVEKGGGAIFCNDATITNCSFIGNYLEGDYGNAAKGGGAIHFMTEGHVNSCIFVDNSADAHGSAIWSKNPTVKNSIFINNTCPNNDVICVYSYVHYENNPYHVNTPFGGSNNWFGNNATNFNETPTQNENFTCDSWLFLNATAIPNAIELYQTSDIAFKLYIYDNTTKKVSEYDNNLLPELNLTVNASAGTLEKNALKLGDSVTFNGTEKGSVTLTARVDYDYKIVDEETGEVTINRATFAEQNIKVKVTEKASEKKDTNLTASGITTTYNVNKNLVITLKDSAGKALSGLKITVDLNGAKNYTTDSNGQVKIAVGKLVPKTYTAKISFAGNDKYAKSNTTAKVTVKKASPKITAKAKTFKFEDKTKKYTVTLKDNKGNALKNKKVTLKVNGKTYTAKTNSKGVATFKLTKLTKKGTYSAVITYAGDKYYKKVTKKAKVTVKAPAWKTVSKGSKDKAMVKKIQRALKNNGYYLNYNGRYLKVDGIFEKYTEMAVKQFQKDKGLKVTGKVDYATAKKLKIVS